MKKFALLLCILAVVSCQDKKTDPETTSEKRFESITVERYAVENGNPDSTSLSSFIKRDYDGEGLETKSIYYSSDSSIMMQFVNQYENGNKTQVDWVNGNDEKVKYVKMSYDSEGRIIRSESFDVSGEFESGFIHQWKDDGRIEEKGPIVEGQPFRPNSIYTYNAEQEFISLVEFDENDSLYGTFTWKYLNFDDTKEWTERQMLFNDTLVRIEKRKIQYQE